MATIQVVDLSMSSKCWPVHLDVLIKIDQWHQEFAETARPFD